MRGVKTNLVNFAGSTLAISLSPKFLCYHSREAFSQMGLYLIKMHSFHTLLVKEQVLEEHEAETNK